jgi:pimeloyl-ACP methyl ester carboxylesterase
MNITLDDIELEQWLTPYERLTVPTRYGNTSMVAAGSKDAPPLVLLPALGVTSKMWLPNLAALGCEYRIYVLDTIGDLGESLLYNSEQYPKNGRAYSEWLVDVFNELGIEQADVIGASMGGWIAMNHAIHAPERVRRIVLLGPMGLPSWWTTLKVMSHLWSVFLFPTRSNIDRIIRWALGDDPHAHGAFADFMRMGAKSWKSLRVAPPLNLSDDQLRKIISPVLLMLGEHDNVIGDAGEVSRRAKRLISNVRVEIIPEAGHMLSTEKSEFVNAHILGFLQYGK